MTTQPKKKRIKKRYIILAAFLSIILALLIGCFYTLSKGISVQRFKVANIEFLGLYLKLDNKLTLTLDSIKIKKQESKTSLNIPKTIKWFQNSLVAISYFERIEVKNITLPDSTKASIFYDGKRYHLDFPRLQALFQIQQNPQNIYLKIQKLIAQDLKTQINGHIQYNIPHGKITFSLIAQNNNNLKRNQEKLIIKGDSNLKTLNISAFSTPFKDLKPYEEELQKIPTLHKWLIQKASFDSVRIKNLFFSAPLDENFVPRMLKSLYAEVDLENVALKLEPELAPITTPFLKVKFQNETLGFDLQNPLYEGIDLQGSSVELHNLTKPNLGVKTLVFLKSKNATLDQRIHRILQTYDIDFDVNQNDSVLDLDLKLSFLAKPDHHLDVEAQGVFQGQQTHLELFGMPIYAETLNVVLDLKPDARHIFINNTMAKLENPLIEGLINCDIDLLEKKLYGQIHPNSIKIQTKTDTQSPLDQIFILDSNDLSQFQIDVDFSHAPLITIPEFDLTLLLDDTKEIIIQNIAKLYPYSPLLKHLMITDGHTKIETKDFKNFLIKGEVSDLKYPIFDKTWKPIKTLGIQAKISDQSISLQSSDQSIAIDYQDHALKVIFQNKNFDLLALKNNKIPALSINSLQTQPQDSKSKDLQSTAPKDQSFSLYLESKNSAIRYQNFTIPTDEIITNIKDQKTTLDATYKNGILNLDLYDDVIRFRANNFSGNFINLIAGKELIQGGLFSGKGLYKNKILRADIEMQNTIFKNFATLQNIVALIDTIPSLIVFKKPGFSTEGYQVKHGRVVLELKDHYLGLKKIDLIGDTIDVSGGGIIDLDTQDLNVSLTISTIKGLSEVLSKIPIVGYLLLGKEGKISTSLILKGTLQNPRSEVTLAEDIISAPFKIIERIFIPD
ncbi:AsmA-like C-terminal domain-containing protein [Helicobacter pametensis]|uniref:YhdP family protein n=1 Tax=Helicobacter pametensis TaxID=95149 RepID=UPI0004B697A3|nr:AsmA-like C-terminal domain-containing protein [Helicobacter pametensis]